MSAPFPISRQRPSRADRARPQPKQGLQPRSAGFSLVEIMVGMVIGMLGIIVMMQIFALAETQKRATTGGGDAQSNGAIAMYGIQRDIREAGYGISAQGLMGCSLQLRAGVTLPAIAPLTINPLKSDGITPLIPPGDANTDTLLTIYGNANTAPQGDTITGQGALGPMSLTPTSAASFNLNDYVIGLPGPVPSPCNLILTQVSSNDGVNLMFPIVMPTLPSTTSTLFNLGQAPRIWAYAVRNGNLSYCDYMANDCSATANTGNAAIWVPVASNIVSMRAQYGMDSNTPMDGMVNSYTQTTPASSCGWLKTLAVDVVLVARNGNFEKNAVTTAAPIWSGSATFPIVLSAVANWQNYRYKTFETVIPMRNIYWMGVTSLC